jgi:hypothetical protein
VGDGGQSYQEEEEAATGEHAATAIGARLPSLLLVFFGCSSISASVGLFWIAKKREGHQIDFLSVRAGQIHRQDLVHDHFFM